MTGKLVIPGKSALAQEVAEALGLKHVRSLDIQFRLTKPVTVKAEYYPEEDEVKRLIPVLKKFRLREIEE